MTKRALAVAALLPLLGAVAGIGAEATAATEATEETPPSSPAEILQPFKARLQQALKEGLAEGPVAAIGACRERAPEIAASLSRNGVRVGRTSHRLRNPANTGPAWVQPILQQYLADPEARKPRTLALEDGGRGYVEPIVMQPLCLTCHGDSLAPELAREIERLYPDDRATGFEVGDLRGVFWLEIPARIPANEKGS